MLSELLIFISWTNNIDWKEKIFYWMFTEVQMYVSRHESKSLPWAECQFLFGNAFHT